MTKGICGQVSLLVMIYSMTSYKCRNCFGIPHPMWCLEPSRRQCRLGYKKVIGGCGYCKPDHDIVIYYIPINDTTLELSVFWPFDTEGWINELRFSESISLSFKTRLTSVTCFCGDVT